MQLLQNKTTFSSLELVEQINIFRKEDGNKNNLRHDNLLAIIRDEFSEEITDLKIQGSEYKDKSGKSNVMFELTLNQSKQILVRESKIVRKAMIAYIEKLELEINKPKELTKLEIIRIAEKSELGRLEALQKVENLTIALDSSLEWCSIIKCATHNKIHESVFKWQTLKKKSVELGYEVKKLPSTRYDYQNAYHVNSFRACYPQYNYNFNNQLALI
jgi:hypothetical protein